MNIYLLSFHIKQFKTLISEHDTFFGVIEAKLRLNKASLNSVIVPECNFKSTTTESSNDGTPIYIKKGLNHKLRKNLEKYRLKQLKSTFNGKSKH